MFIGGIVYSRYAIIHKRSNRALFALIVAAFVGSNIYWNQRIQIRWDKVSNETRGALNEIMDLVVKNPPNTTYGFINFPPRQDFGASLFKVFFEPYDMGYGIWPIPPNMRHVKILFLIQINGHIYNDPDEARKAASTPWEHFYVANFYLLMGDNKNGISELDKATVSAFDAKLHYIAAIQYKKLGLADKAIEEFKKVIQINEHSKYSSEVYKQLVRNLAQL